MKLEAHGQAQLVVLARQAGFIRTGDVLKANDDRRISAPAIGRSRIGAVSYEVITGRGRSLGTTTVGCQLGC